MRSKEEVKAILDSFLWELKGAMNHDNDMSGLFIAGGSIVSLVLGEEPHDFDVWFRSISHYEQAITDMRFYVPQRTSRFSTTYKLGSGKIVQLIKNRLGEPEKTISGFDFRHTQAFYDPSTGRLEYDEALIVSKNLEFCLGNLEHPVNTFQRVLKFVRRGYYVKNNTIIDLMLECRKVPIEDIQEDRAGSR